MPWQLRGTILQACNCDYGCPCNFNAPPTYGHCEGAWTWHVDEGAFDGVNLGGLNFTLFGDWPRAIHCGDGQALLLVDERADAAQRNAITTLLTGKAGNPWEVLASTFTSWNGPFFVPYEVKVEGARSSVRAGNHLRLDMEPIINPVSGAEVFPEVVLPQGFVYQRSVRASSRVFHVTMKPGQRFESHGKDAAVAPFEYRHG